MADPVVDPNAQAPASTPTPQAIGPQPVPQSPDISNMASARPPQQAPQQQPGAPPPQQAKPDPNAHHTMLGKAANFLFGSTTDPTTGEPVKQKPGQMFRSILAGAVLGGALGSESKNQGGFGGGFLRGAEGVREEDQQRQKAGLEQANKQKQMTLEQQKADTEQTIKKAELEHLNLEQIASIRDAGFRNREFLDKENEQDANLEKWTLENRAQFAPIPNNGEKGNAIALQQGMIKDPGKYNPPPGYGRVIFKHYDLDGLTHNDKTGGWTTEDGRPANLDQHATVKVYFTPLKSEGKSGVAMPGSDWEKYYDVKGLDPKRVYSADETQGLVNAMTASKKANRTSADDDFKQRHDTATAIISTARTNIIQLEENRRRLVGPGDGGNESDPEVKKIDQQIKDEKQREQEAIDSLHPIVRAKVTGQDKLPKAPQSGAALPDSVLQQYKSAYGSDKAGALKALMANGWDPNKASQ